MQVPVGDIINFLISGTLFLVLLAGFIILLVKLFDKARRNFQLEKENISREFETQLLQTQLEIQEQTLENVSQEIHDNIGQSLILVKLTINNIDLRNEAESSSKLRQSVDLVAKSIQDLRNLAKTLNPSFIQEIGLVAGIKQQLVYLEKAGAYIIDFQVLGNADNYQHRTEILLFRIVQELLNNTVKHADATAIDILADYKETELRLSVTDNGKGFELDPVGPPTGLGLKNIRSRLALIQGDASIESRPGAGTKVMIRVPRYITM